MTGNEDLFSGESGFKDDYDMTVVDAWFATDANYNNGDTLLFYLKQQPDDQDEQVEDRWACGNKWQSLDGGETAQHPDDKVKFNIRSQVQQLITAAVESGALEELAKGRPTEAKIWIGLRFHMMRVSTDYNFTDRETGEKKEGTREILLPSAFLGTVDAAIDAERPAEVVVVDDEIQSKLAAIKAECDTHEQFMDRAMELPEITGDTKLVMAIADPDGLYQQL